MKRVLLIMMIAVLSVSCSDDDAQAALATNPYAGTYRTIGMYDSDGVYHDYSDCNNAPAGGIYQTYTFTENGRYNFYWTCDPQPIIEVDDEYDVQDNYLTLFENGEGTTYTVSFLENGLIQWRSDFTNSQGEPDHIKIVLQKL